LQREGQALISGHPQFCPEPVLVTLEGSTWGGSMLKSRYIGRGMHLEFRHPAYPVPIVTSRIEEIQPLGEPCHAKDSREAPVHSRQTESGPAQC
jgi:hypothetical protein